MMMIMMIIDIDDDDDTAIKVHMQSKLHFLIDQSFWKAFCIDDRTIKQINNNHTK
jgi:hypothetical protein